MSNEQALFGNAGMRNELAASLSYITDFITDHYSAHPNRTSNIILNALVRGNADGLMSIRGGPFYSGDPFATTAQTPLNHGPGTFGTLTASRAESSHPLLRRPSRVLATTQGASYRPTDHESMNIVITNDGGEMAFDQGPQIYIENAMNALGAMRSRVSERTRLLVLICARGVARPRRWHYSYLLKRAWNPKSRGCWVEFQ
jgi:hypothetical protein